MTDMPTLDVAGRRRSPATMPGYHAGRPPRNRGMQYPADPPTVDEIVAVMRHTGDNRHGFRLRAMIVVLWRAGLRVQEALALTEHARRGLRAARANDVRHRGYGSEYQIGRRGARRRSRFANTEAGVYPSTHQARARRPAAGVSRSTTGTPASKANAELSLAPRRARRSAPGLAERVLLMPRRSAPVWGAGEPIR